MATFRISLAALIATVLITQPAGAQVRSPSVVLGSPNPFGIMTNIAHKETRRQAIRVAGVITEEGAECTALRGDDGRLYTLAGGAGGFKPGDRVRVIGRVAQASICMQGTTIEVRRVVALR
jgi:hypothetical protein